MNSNEEAALRDASKALHGVVDYLDSSENKHAARAHSSVDSVVTDLRTALSASGGVDVPMRGDAGYTPVIVKASTASAAAPSSNAARRGEWFTLHQDGVIYRKELTGPNTAKYVVVCRDCSVEDAEFIVNARNSLSASGSPGDVGREYIKAPLPAWLGEDTPELRENLQRLQGQEAWKSADAILRAIWDDLERAAVEAETDDYKSQDVSEETLRQLSDYLFPDPSEPIPAQIGDEIGGMFESVATLLETMGRETRLSQQWSLMLKECARILRTRAPEGTEVGWQAVPKVPTFAMLQRGYPAMMKAYKEQVYGEAIMSAAWEAMLAAAPLAAKPVSVETIAREEGGGDGR